jgi:FlaA1/EpsC-like NDP-sugar epimerase
MEIVTQVCVFGPRRLILFETDETELHNLGLRLARLFPHLSGEIEYVTGDVRDELRVQEIFRKYRPEIIFHAAAYKHVPMMEHNPREAAKVNIFGTLNISRAAVECGTETFVMISTDKAVRPTSVMGATKRMAEFICRAFNEINRDSALLIPEEKLIGRCPYLLPTKFMSVRFGNVLGSRGSVLPIFLDQLKHGGPLTVTDREMKRYFMTIPEAVSLVLQASILGQGGEVFVLDMGEPVMIVHIAEELIRLHGLEPYKDIDIHYTGLRPGEKLFEEILTAEEGTDASCHEKIFVARNSSKYTMADLSVILQEFSDAVNDISAESDDNMKALLKKYVKHYTENNY